MAVNVLPGPGKPHDHLAHGVAIEPAGVLLAADVHRLACPGVHLHRFVVGEDDQAGLQLLPGLDAAELRVGPALASANSSGAARACRAASISMMSMGPPVSEITAAIGQQRATGRKLCRPAAAGRGSGR